MLVVECTLTTPVPSSMSTSAASSTTGMRAPLHEDASRAKGQATLFNYKKTTKKNCKKHVFTYLPAYFPTYLPAYLPTDLPT